MQIDKAWYQKTGLVNPLIAFYFFLAVINIIAEYHQDHNFFSYTKPFIILFLVLIYILTAKTKNKFYLVSLFLAIFSNLFLTLNGDSYPIVANGFLFLFQLSIIYVIMQKMKFPGIALCTISSLPFVTLSFLVFLVIYEKHGPVSYLFLLEAILIAFAGSLALANFLMKYNKANSHLFYGMVLLSSSQLLFILANTFTNNKLLVPLTSFSFVLGHYFLYKFVISKEKHRRKYKLVQ